jgi:hypothetical protein
MKLELELELERERERENGHVAFVGARGYNIV